MIGVARWSEEVERAREIQGAGPSMREGGLLIEVVTGEEGVLPEASLNLIVLMHTVSSRGIFFDKKCGNQIL